MAEEKVVCHVKTIVNPKATTSFAIRFQVMPKKEVYLKIILPNVDSLQTILDEIKKQIPMKYNFNVQFNFKNVPKSIEENKIFKEEILKIFNYYKAPTLIVENKDLIINKNNMLNFNNTNAEQFINSLPIQQTKTTSQYTQLASLIKVHVDNHGAAPDFKNNFSEKNKIKIHNYMKTVLAMPKLTMAESIIINELLNQ